MSRRRDATRQQGRRAACYAPDVRRFAQVIVVLLLAFSVSDAASLLVPEPCAAVERTTGDSNCPPTCVTCGCCHQAVDLAIAMPLLVSPRPLVEATEPLDSLSDHDPRDILHVPRRAA